MSHHVLTQSRPSELFGQRWIQQQPNQRCQTVERVCKGCRCSLHSLAFLQHCLTGTQPITCSFCSKWQLHCLLLCLSLHEGFSGFADWLSGHVASSLAQVRSLPSEDLLRKLTLASAALKLAVSEYTAYQQQIQNAPQHEQLPVQNGG